MKIIVCGDTHGYFGELNKLINKEKPDIILQAGDFGYWPREHGKTYLSERGRIKAYDQFSVRNPNTKIYFAPGNHEDWHSLNELTTEQAPFEIPRMSGIYYMPKGTTLTLPDGRVVLFMGGAASIDKKWRTPNIDWFAEELITEADLMKLPDVKVDIIISHTAPEAFNVLYKREGIGSEEYGWNDPSRKRLDYVFRKYKPKEWYFGHFHLYKPGWHNACNWRALSYAGSGMRWWIEI